MHSRSTSRARRRADATSAIAEQIFLQFVDRGELDRALRQLGFDRAVHEQRIGHAVDHAGLVDRRVAASVRRRGRLRRRTQRRRGRLGGRWAAGWRAAPRTRVSGARSTLRCGWSFGRRRGRRAARVPVAGALRAAEPAEQRGPRRVAALPARRAPDAGRVLAPDGRDRRKRQRLDLAAVRRSARGCAPRRRAPSDQTADDRDDPGNEQRGARTCPRPARRSGSARRRRTPARRQPESSIRYIRGSPAPHSRNQSGRASVSKG